MWVNCFSNHNELTISPLGKTPFAPSETHRIAHRSHRRLRRSFRIAPIVEPSAKHAGEDDVPWLFRVARATLRIKTLGRNQPQPNPIIEQEPHPRLSSIRQRILRVNPLS